MSTDTDTGTDTGTGTGTDADAASGGDRRPGIGELRLHPFVASGRVLVSELDGDHGDVPTTRFPSGFCIGGNHDVCDPLRPITTSVDKPAIWRRCPCDCHQLFVDADRHAAYQLSPLLAYHDVWLDGRSPEAVAALTSFGEPTTGQRQEV